jgi:hypothetical protein
MNYNDQGTWEKIYTYIYIYIVISILVIFNF